MKTKLVLMVVGLVAVQAWGQVTQDSVFCQKTKQEYDSLREQLFKKRALVISEVDYLENRHPGVYFYIECDSLVLFNWKGCKHDIVICHDCGCPFYDENVVDAEFNIKRLDLSWHGSRTSTIYYDQIQSFPK